MTLLIDIEGRQALPLRAVKFVTNGLIDERWLADLLCPCDWRAAYGLRAFRFVDGRREDMPRGQFVGFKKAVEAASKLDGAVATEAAVPEGVFVWADDLRALHESVELDTAIQESPDGYIQLAGGWHCSPCISEQQSKYVWAGADIAKARKVRTPMQKLDEKGNDPVLQAIANRIGGPLRSAGKPASKKVVVELMKVELGIEKSRDLSRRINVEW